jgi:hypothetical protein
MTEALTVKHPDVQYSDLKKTAQDFRDEAAADRKRREDSWNRSDTDGFLSQWGSDLSARLSNAKADLLDNDRLAKFSGLFEGDRRVKAREIRTKFGSSWLLHEDEVDLIDRRGKVFLPWGPRSRIHKELGLSVRTELAPAWACFGGGEGKGLSGCHNVHVKTFRTGDKWGQDAVLAGEDK